jgi:hypothetical protein
VDVLDELTVTAAAIVRLACAVDVEEIGVVRTASGAQAEATTCGEPLKPLIVRLD